MIYHHDSPVELAACSLDFGGVRAAIESSKCEHIWGAILRLRHCRSDPAAQTIARYLAETWSSRVVKETGADCEVGDLSDIIMEFFFDASAYVGDLLDQFNIIMPYFFGQENTICDDHHVGFEFENTAPIVWFINSGDAYDATIIFVEDLPYKINGVPEGVPFIGTWGDVIEALEAAASQEEPDEYEEE